MKHFPLPLLLLCFSVLPRTGGLTAQMQAESYIINTTKNVSETEQTGSEEISSKVLKSFAKTYKNAKNVTWSKNKDGFYATFTSDNARCRVIYTPSGKWSSSIKGYSEEKLPRELGDIVKNAYHGYTIFYVEELEAIFSNQLPTYIIHIESQNDIKLIRLYDRDMDVWKEFKKSTSRAN